MSWRAQARACRGEFLQASAPSFALILHFLAVTLFVNSEGGAAQNLAQQLKHTCCRAKCEELGSPIGKAICQGACDRLINSTSKGQCASTVAENMCTSAPHTLQQCRKQCQMMFEDCNFCAAGYEEDVTLYNASACGTTPVVSEECRDGGSCYKCTCRPCPVGWYCTEGSISTACARGTYQAQTKQTSDGSCIASVIKCSQERAKKEGVGMVDSQSSSHKLRDHTTCVIGATKELTPSIQVKAHAIGVKRENTLELGAHKASRIVRHADSANMVSWRVP